MGFFEEVAMSFTPQVVFGMIGGFAGGVYGINKKRYGVKISIILLFTATIAGSAVAEILNKYFGLTYLLAMCLIAIPAGTFSGYLMLAVDTASPGLATSVVEKVGKKGLDKI